MIINVVDSQWLYASIVAGLAAAFFLGLSLLAISIRFLRSREGRKAIPPSLRVQESISKLSKASEEVDRVIRDVVAEMKAREDMLEELRKEHAALSEEERKLSDRVDALKHVRIEAAQYFQEINQKNLEQTEKKRARRDFYFLLIGIILTTAIGIILKLLGLG